jgi:hypothetical protein
MTSYFHCRPPLHPTQAKEVASEPSPRGTNTIYYAVIILIVLNSSVVFCILFQDLVHEMRYSETCVHSLAFGCKLNTSVEIVL